MHSAGRQICRISPVKSEDLIEIYRRSGRPEDFEQIVRRFAALVLCECRRVTGNIYDAEDASQLVFLALAMEIKSGTDIHQLGAWLKRVSRRQALKIVRSRTRRKKREDAVRRSELHLVDTDSPLDQQVIAGIVRDAIDSLPERYRMAVVLHYFGGMTLELIAVELKISRQAVGTRLHRGRKMLAERLERQGVKLENGQLVGALAVLVPAAVVSAIVHHATNVYAPAAVGQLPMTMVGMLRVTLLGAAKRPLRLAVLGLALAGAGGALARVAASQIRAIRTSTPGSVIRWLNRTLRRDLPSLRPAPIAPLSDAKEWSPKLAPPDLSPTLPVVAFDPIGIDVASVPDAARPRGSNGPIAYTQTQFAALRSESLGAPILQTPAQFAHALPPPVSRDWATPEPLRIATRANDASPAKPKEAMAPSLSPRATVIDTTVTVRPDTTTDADDIRIGVERPVVASAGGVGGGGGGSAAGIVNNAGRMVSNRMTVGYTGPGFYRQHGNAQLSVGQMLIGAKPQAAGEVSIESGTVELTSNSGGLQVGVAGTGRLNLGSADAPGVIRSAPGVSAPVVIRASRSAKGTLKGWGVVRTGDALINNGQVIADGYGQVRSLDLSSLARIDNTIDNPPDGTNGWYAQNGGQLMLPAIQVSPGTHAYTWGESPTDPTIDLVNSLRFTVHDQPAPAKVNISLDSTTIDEAHDLTAARGVSVVSIYHFGGATLRAANLNFAVRFKADTSYSFARGASYNLLASSNGQWVMADAITIDTSQRLIYGNFYGTIEYLAVAVQPISVINPNPAEAPIAITINANVPEPGGLAILGTMVLLMRRRRASQTRFSDPS